MLVEQKLEWNRSPQKVKYRITMTQQLHSWYIPPNIENRYLNKYLHTNFHSNIIHNNLKVGKNPNFQQYRKD